MERRILSVVCTCLVLFALSSTAGNASGQTPSKEAARERRAIVTAAQQEYATKENKKDGVIRLGADGPLDPEFQHFDIPFPVAFWYCDRLASPAKRDPLQEQTIKERLDRAKQCQTGLKDAMASTSEMVTFRFDDESHHDAQNPTRIKVRIIGAPATLPPGPGAERTEVPKPNPWHDGVELDLGRREAKIPLADLFTYGVRGRVDILLFVEKDGKFVPKTGLSLTFENIPELPVAPYATVSRASAAARAAHRAASAAARTSPATGPVQTCQPEPYEHRVNIRLDRTGVAISKFLNPRWPVLLGPNQDEPCDKTLETWQKQAALVFVNRVADRQFVVTFSGIGEANRWAFMNAGLRSSNCRDGECDAVILVPPGGPGEKRVPVELLYDAYVKGKKRVPVLSFGVALFDEDAQLANPSGFFSLVPYQLVEEQGDASKWSATLTGAFGFSPDLSDLAPTADDDPKITDIASRGGANETRFSGTARLSLVQRLGSRARGEFDLRLKSGGFGEGGTPTVSATKYKLNVFAIQGMTFSGGRFDITSPSESIALSESGENIGMHVRFLDVNHIFKKNVPELRRDVLDFEDGPSARDHSATVVQLRGVPAFTWKRAKLDLYGIFGRKKETRCMQSVNVKCPAAPKKDEEAESAEESVDANASAPPPPPDVFELEQHYTTFGSELSFGFLNGFTGSAAIYTSQLWTPEQPVETEQILTDRGRGTVGLITLGWTKFDDASSLDTRPVDFTLRGQYGIGTGDDPTHEDNENDGYLGETAGFAPDVLFLALLAPASQTSHGQVGAGLTNWSASSNGPWSRASR
jgi:hypothetical protein